MLVTTNVRMHCVLMSNHIVKRMVYWQSTLQFNGFPMEFQSSLVNGVLGLF